MANINDYLDWRGDIAISSDYEFNEVDSIILARFSYLLFDKIDLKENETIESISKKMKKFPNEDFNYNGDKDLITKLGESKRFKSMKVSDYVKNNNFEAEEQFSAITVHLSDNEMYLSFLGTDGSIIGWKEDFNMSFMENIPAQISGKKYTEIVANKYPNKRIILGGHSKGGNLVINTAVKCGEKIQRRIDKVFNFDGPGFTSDFYELQDYKAVEDRIYSFYPEFSVVGMIFHHPKDCKKRV